MLYRKSMMKTWKSDAAELIASEHREDLAPRIPFPGYYPSAVKIAAGKIDAATGKPWSVDPADEPQNYVVIPTQPWLDGFCVRRRIIRQFVAMPLGNGYSAEEQITGHTKYGGLRISWIAFRTPSLTTLSPGVNRFSGLSGSGN
jgi:hypothetical protein